MRLCLIFALFAASAAAQQCSQGNAALFQDDLVVSGTCNPPGIINGNTQTVKETQGYNVSCIATSGSSIAGTTYFSDKLVLAGNGQRYCGDFFISAFNCDPRYTMTTTTAATPSDFNTFTFQEFDRVVDGGVCDQPFGFQQLFRQCQGKACDAPPPPPDPTPTPCASPDGDPTPLIRNGDPGDTNNPCASPIIIDTSGNGYRLTSAANGVLFDIAGTGTPMRLGWTQPGSGNAFLILPGANGIVSTGQQLFGNFTPQPPSATPNGYAALAVYDQPDHGGNGDGVIDQKDEIFSSLRLWLDENHDGVCQPGELHRLPDLGVFSISLNYSLSHRVDGFGNVFRYRADVNSSVSGESAVGRKAFDVFLTTQ